MAPQRLNLGILISGRGSNMQALIEACRDESFPARAAVVIANRPDAGGIGKAAAAGIATAIVDHKNFPDKPSFEQALEAELQRHDTELVCLAGFMRILSASFIQRRAGRIINIHPSLLPDYKGLDTHARALADGREKSGCTVHYVIPEMDAGPVILQKQVAIVPGDTADSLAARVLAEEHKAYPEAVRLIAPSLLQLKGRPGTVYQG